MSKARWVLATLALTIGGGCDEITQPPEPRVDSVAKTRDGTYQGWKPPGSIPRDYYFRNEGGTDGAGLCVTAASAPVMRHLGWESEAKAAWQWAKRHPGGSYPEKFRGHAAEAFPDVPYFSYVGNDWGIMEQLAAAGIPYAGTMGWDPAIYGEREVPHFVTWEWFGRNAAAYVDNNRPEVTTYVPRREAERRATAGTGNGQSWILAFAPREGFHPSESAAATGGLLLGGAILLGATFLALLPTGDGGEDESA